MRLKQLTWLGTWVIVPVFLLLAGTVLAQESVIVQLEAVGGSGVSGTARLSIAGEGTNVALDVEGLTPGATAQGAMHAGTCTMPSASFATLPELETDASGKSTATGSVLFRGIEDVALVTMADGEHIIVIRTEEVAACGVIPQLTAPPGSLPVTGGLTSSLISFGVGALGFFLLGVGLFLKYSSRFLCRFCGPVK